MRLVLLIGAGFSKWAVDLPTANQLFDFNIEPWGPRDYQKLELAKSLKRSWDEINPGGPTEQFIAYALNLHPKNREAVLWYLARRLSEPFIWKEFHSQRWRRHVLMIDENRRFNIPGVIKARNFLQRFYHPSLGGIVTTNYDMLLEYALGTKRFNYGVSNQPLIGRGPYPLAEWRKPVMLQGNVPIAKIHGSISWDAGAQYTDGRRAITGYALIVAPTQEKRCPECLQSVWELAERILKSAMRLLVFGFSFNPYDEAVLNLLQSGGQNLESVLLVDIEPKIEQARSLWPRATIMSCQPPPEGDEEIQNWQTTISRMVGVQLSQ